MIKNVIYYVKMKRESINFDSINHVTRIKVKNAE